MSRSALVRLVRMALAFGVLALLIVRIGHAAPLERLARTNLGWLAAGVVVVVCDGMLRAWNWMQLIRAMHLAQHVRYRTVLGLFWSGSFLGQVVPSTAGTDAIRAVLAARVIGGHASAHAAAVVMLNAISLTTGCVIGLACALFLAMTMPEHAVRLPVMTVFAGAITAAVAAYWMVRRQRGFVLWILRRFPRPLHGLRRGLRRFIDRILVFERHHVRAAPIFLVAFLTLLTRAATFSCVGLAVGVHLPVPAWIAMVPANMLSGVIPYSVAGFGGDQAAMVYIITGLGASAGSALALALLLPLMAMAFNMLGGLAVAFGKSTAAARALPQPGGGM